MSVEFIPASVVHDVSARVQRARAQALEAVGQGNRDDEQYWLRLFESNAQAVLEALSLVNLASDYVVRYCFFGSQLGDLLIRPFVARETTDVTAVRRIIDWHPPPDSTAATLRNRPTKDVELFYSHFDFERSARGYFEYWIAVQEFWGSARWIHSRVIADRVEFKNISQADGWSIDHEVDRYEPAVLREEEDGAHLAVLVYCPLERAVISLQRVRIAPDQAVEYLDTIPVAHSRFGYHLH
jgi:hypothetical protein